MENHLRYVGITHETASVEERTYFALNQAQKNEFTEILRRKFQMNALIVVTTCNRTEIYFESGVILAKTVRKELITYVKRFHEIETSQEIVQIYEESKDTIHHLLHVSNGLRSAVIGDKQIINQVKTAYLHALKHNQQGSLLERAFQAVFRSHKRIFSESLYQHGSTSTAYSSLKLIAQHFGQTTDLNLLIVGAGEIAEDLLKYLSKFQFKEVAIANRTTEKATQLAKRYHIQTYDWEHVEGNDFADFDVVITAVSNRRHLVHTVNATPKQRLWIDLAMPANIDSNIADAYNKVYNIDEITSLVTLTNQAQLDAIPVVEQIIKEEQDIVLDWLEKGKMRTFLKTYKQNLMEHALEMIPTEIAQNLGHQELERYAKTLVNKLVREFAKALKNETKEEVMKKKLTEMHSTL